MLAQECERNQTFNEEWVNSITHLAGAFFTLIGTYFLVEQALQFQDQAKADGGLCGHGLRWAGTPGMFHLELLLI